MRLQLVIPETRIHTSRCTQQPRSNMVGIKKVMRKIRIGFDFLLLDLKEFMILLLHFLLLFRTEENTKIKSRWQRATRSVNIVAS